MVNGLKVYFLIKDGAISESEFLEFIVVVERGASRIGMEDADGSITLLAARNTS